MSVFLNLHEVVASHNWIAFTHIILCEEQRKRWSEANYITLSSTHPIQYKTKEIVEGLKGSKAACRAIVSFAQPHIKEANCSLSQNDASPFRDEIMETGVQEMVVAAITQLFPRRRTCVLDLHVRWDMVILQRWKCLSRCSLGIGESLSPATATWDFGMGSRDIENRSLILLLCDPREDMFSVSAGANVSFVSDKLINHALCGMWCWVEWRHVLSICDNLCRILFGSISYLAQVSIICLA
jgi:hypothetical protein